MRLGWRGIRGSAVFEMRARKPNGTGRSVRGKGMTEDRTVRTGVRTHGVRVRGRSASKTDVLNRSARKRDGRNGNPNGHSARRGRGTSGHGELGHSAPTSGRRVPNVRGRRNVPIPAGGPVSIADVPLPDGLRAMPAGAVVRLSARRTSDAGMRPVVRRIPGACGMPGEDRAPAMDRVPNAGKSPCQTCRTHASSRFSPSSCSCLH